MAWWESVIMDERLHEIDYSHTPCGSVSSATTIQDATMQVRVVETDYLSVHPLCTWHGVIRIVVPDDYIPMATVHSANWDVLSAR